MANETAQVLVKGKLDATRPVEESHLHQESTDHCCRIYLWVVRLAPQNEPTTMLGGHVQASYVLCYLDSATCWLQWFIGDYSSSKLLLHRHEEFLLLDTPFSF